MCNQEQYHLSRGCVVARILKWLQDSGSLLFTHILPISLGTNLVKVL